MVDYLIREMAITNCSLYFYCIQPYQTIKDYKILNSQVTSKPWSKRNHPQKHLIAVLYLFKTKKETSLLHVNPRDSTSSFKT